MFELKEPGVFELWLDYGKEKIKVDGKDIMQFEIPDEFYAKYIKIAEVEIEESGRHTLKVIRAPEHQGTSKVKELKIVLMDYVFCILFLPAFFLGLMHFVPPQFGFRIVMTRGNFFTQEAGWAILILIAILVWRERLENTYRWFDTREFCDKCILAFIFLLILCAIF